MITDHYSKAVKTRAQETTTVQDTPQDIERMKIAMAVRGIPTKTMIRNAKTCENKSIMYRKTTTTTAIKQSQTAIAL